MPPPGSCAAWSVAADGAGLVVGRVYTLHGGSAGESWGLPLRDTPEESLGLSKGGETNYMFEPEARLLKC